MKIVKRCEICGKEMIKPPHYSYKQWEAKRYCSNECSGEAKKTGEMRKCIVCGKEFYWKPSMKRGLYCSLSCSAKVSKNALGKHWKIKDTSKMTWTEERKKEWSEMKKGKKMAADHKRKISLGHGGTGITQITSKRYYHLRDVKYKEWRMKVFLRDNYTCQMCGVRNQKGKPVYLEPHHIKGWAKYPELRYEVKNGITLCKSCHRLVHTKILK